MNTPPTHPSTLHRIPPGGDNFHDVTKLIEKASDAMQTGQMLTIDRFTLLDAMNAIEIMDPRMDNGVTLTNDEESRIPQFNPHAPLTADEMSWVLDRMIAAEMDWHSGKFMANSIHTLEYVHVLPSLSNPPAVDQTEEDLHLRPQELITSVLRPCVIGFLKTCDLLWRQLTRGLVYDGEDFHAEKFEVGLCEGLQTQKVLDNLDAAEERLNAWTSLPGREMLLLRVQLRKSLIRAFSHQPDSISPSQVSQLRSARDLLQQILSSKVPSEPTATSAARAAFDPAICRKLVVVTPLKPIPLSSQEDAWVVLTNELDGLIEVFELAEQGTAGDWMIRLLLLSRCRHQTALVRNTTTILLKQRPPQWALDLVYRNIVPIPHDTILSLASNLGHMLVGSDQGDDHLLFNGVMSLQRGFQEIAVQLSFRLPLVIHHLRLTIITEYVMAGFELELYEKSEWPFLYWYVAVILGEQVGTLNDLLQTLDPDHEGTEATRRLQSTLKWCEGLQRICWGRFVMLVPLIGTPALTPHLDSDRQRRNMMKRFDWSFPSAQDPTTLEDSGRPDWNAYQTAVARLRSREV
ncbi:hypothetical protein FRB90_000121 [Tulasnella sp. 427]|nr:hypothetical protein FRB90_000121 [Tulasnella sp. 427]